MTYFQRNLKYIQLPPQAEGTGVRRAQLGACFAIGQHFSVSSETALVVLPTGAGKTAVMTISPFLIPPIELDPIRRVLVLTPSKIVRKQVAAEFAHLRTLTRTGLVKSRIKPPKVAEVEGYRSSVARWDELRKADVAVAIPASVSPHYQEIVTPPGDLFDIILVDEAHHAAASTWKQIIDAFPTARKVFFTATPYRRDRREIAASLIYAYPLRQALRDGIYRPITFVPVEAGDDAGVALSQVAKRLVEEEKAEGRKARIIIRTDRIEEAEALKGLYETQGLRIDTIHSRKGGQVDAIIEGVRSGELDGLAAVGMLGEGFDLPELKIAVVHSPHKSLASTLQFAGRISRDAPEEYGSARFVAVPQAVNDLTAELFREDQDWGELIPNLADAAVAEEQTFRRFLGRFRRLDGATEHISLYGLRPYQSAKLYTVNGHVNLDAQLDLPVEALLTQHVFDTDDLAIFITANTVEPKWSPDGELFQSDFHLFIYLYNVESHLLLEHSSDDEIAKTIRQGIITGTHSVVRKGKLSGLLSAGEKVVYLQVGLGKTGAAGGRVAQYKTYAGSDVGGSVATSDSRVSTPHHVLAKIDGVQSFGFSGSGSVWSMQRGTLADFYGWGQRVIAAIQGSDEVMRLPGLPSDFQTYPVERLEASVIAAGFASKVFELDATLVHRQDENVSILSITLEPVEVDEYKAEIILRNTHTQEIARVFYDCREDVPFTLDAAGRAYQVVLNGATGVSRTMTFQDFLQDFPLTLFLMNGATIYNNELKPLSGLYVDLDNECYIDHAQNWQDCIIAKEIWEADDDMSQYTGKLNVQESTVRHLQAIYPDAWILIDHGAPELADVIAINPAPSRPEIHFVHCKGSREAPGRRVGDLFEVIGQTIKGARWVRHEDLIDELTRRIDTRAELHQGDADKLKTFLQESGLNSFSYFIHAVQPGVNVFGRKEHSPDASTRLLLGAFEWLRAQEIEFRFMGWNLQHGSARWVNRPDA